MKQKVIRGIVKKNTRGRAYLVYFGPSQERKILRLHGKINAANGRAVIAKGGVEGCIMHVERLTPVYFPVRRSRAS